MDIVFFLNSILLGVGLAMDAFSVSIANSLNEPDMKLPRMCLIAGVFGAFQAIMPMTGWICVTGIKSLFEGFQKFIPWIALLLLLYIGGKMLIEGIRHKEEDEKAAVGFGALLVQGIATSIDALSVGFTIAEYDMTEAIIASVIIAAVTFGICMGGLVIGKTVGKKLTGKASILGGIILIGIGIEIFVTHWSSAMQIFG
ncbi:MAG: hypothetical protein CW338_04695 [Clostridiales bacterium]|nr:hypothetical protein [Clostridiales bacterium]